MILNAFCLRRTSTFAPVAWEMTVYDRRPFLNPWGNASCGIPATGPKVKPWNHGPEKKNSLDPDHLTFQRGKNFFQITPPSGIGNAPSTAPRFWFASVGRLGRWLAEVSGRMRGQNNQRK